mgnify:CR=1 FL=1
MPNNISEEELEERVALLKRFKELLEKQRQKFRDYLNVLEKQAEVIKTEDTEALLIHTEIEQQIVANIQNLQKVIEPIEQMYISSRKLLVKITFTSPNAIYLPSAFSRPSFLASEMLSLSR